MPFQIPPAAVSRFKFRLWNCRRSAKISRTAWLNKAIINIKRSRWKAVTALNIIVIVNYPSPRTKLASPRKRGGGTAVEVFRLAVQYSDSPAFTILKLFRAVTVGIVNALEAFMIALLSISISYAPSSLSKTALSLALHHHPCLPCQREVD